MPGQYVPQLFSSGSEAVVTYMFRPSGSSPSKILPLSQASRYITFMAQSFKVRSETVSCKGLMVAVIDRQEFTLLVQNEPFS
jgi:hypothetical protein